MKKILNTGLLLGVIGVAVLFFVLDPNKHELFPRCIFHSLTGAYCPGCGSQRALHSLLHFDIAGVVSYNLLFLPAGLFLLYHYLHLVLNRLFKWKLPNLFYMKNTPWVIFAIVIVFWITRNLPWYPFSVLAPG
ncbi:DUF2752 domain-containing protein [Prolixibacteraceae bacterium Z1-6]|uniref:DUF2752 domain-containing protein n=1 Tax=Draconibacterium aestuarii TaxID=2998507 RepID=A0A9X3F516_9BACT|nr:DUF2752 domain-containing protein [Prolixibacteraceae bacterium Z1-6]